MTRKDYIAIAEALASAHSWVNAQYGGAPEPDSPLHEPLDIARENIADVLAADNPRFDRERFLAAARGE